MKPFWNRALSIEAQFRLLLGGIIMALLVLSLWSYRVMTIVAVNGPVYNKVVVGKDLVEDVLPPPQYVVESFLLTNQIRSAAPANRAALVQRLEKQRELFYRGHEAWIEKDLPPNIKRLIGEEVYRPADAFFHEFEQGFLPAIDQGDRAAADASYARLAVDYEENRKAVDRLVAELQQYQQELESDAARTIRRSYIDLGLASLAALIVMSMLVLRQMGAAVSRNIRNHSELSKAHEEARIAAESANRSKGEFLANMSHEIRTPMNAIVGMTHLAMTTELTPKQRDYLHKIKISADSLLATINDILDFSKIEAGKLDLDLRQFYLSGMVNSVATIVGVKAQESGVLFSVETAADVPDALVGDSSRIGQVLLNLCSNAVKFTPQGGAVTVEIRVAAREGDAVHLHFSVQDSGIGLTGEEASRLFQPFTQVDTSTTRRFGGTGLGLAICKQLVDLMGGKIGVRTAQESRTQPGCEFYFDVPLGLGHAARIGGEKLAAGSAIDNAPALRRFHVLVVDDNATARQICLELLPTLGCTGVAVSSAAEGLALLEKESSKPFDLVLIDWMMPGIDGIKMAHMIRRNSNVQFTQPKIALMTAYTSDEVRQRVTQHNFDGFLVKPLSLASLFDGVNAIFGQPTSLTEAATESAAVERPTIAGRSVLVVEDTEFNQLVACELLTDVADMKVSIAENGQVALDLLKTQKFDIVLMDVQMPVMDGYEATRHIRRDPAFANLPIIAMTAHALSTDRDACLAVGMNDFISKPFDPARLFDIIARWMPEALKDAHSAPMAAAGMDGAGAATAVPIINYAKGLKHCYGKEDFYKKLLKTFVEMRSKEGNNMRALLAQDEVPAAARVAHTMKSVAGTIGAEKLSETAMELQFALDARELRRAEPLLQKFDALLVDTIAEAAGLLGEIA